MNILELFRNFQTVFGICPCCGEVFRLGDAQVFIGRVPPRTVFDRLDADERGLKEATERFEAREDRVRERALEQGRAAAQRELRRIAPAFSANRIDPNDVKVIFDPVEYVAFCGLNDAGCSRIQFIGRAPTTARRERTIRSLERTLRRGDVEWHTYRVSDDGAIGVEN